MTKQEKAEGEHMRKVYRLIRQLGMTSKYKGYYYVAEAVMMSMELQDYPIKITKDIYPHLAKKFKSTPVNIEHDIRTGQLLHLFPEWCSNVGTVQLVYASRKGQRLVVEKLIDTLITGLRHVSTHQVGYVP